MTDGATLGRYELRGTLGWGGFATVYRAYDPALGREVALKALLPHLARHPEVRRRFLLEARAIAPLAHPNIVSFFDVDEAGAQPFYTMELIEGPTLAALIGAGVPLPVPRVFEILRNLCSAVDYLHNAGLVHRDIKASNVMLDPAGRAVLMDFGIARVLDQTQYTRTGASLGTPESMAPEQVRGLEIGPAADIYALGILAYQLFAGHPPFQGDTGYVLHAQVYQPPPPLADSRPDVPSAVWVAIQWALNKSPDLRPPDAMRFFEQWGGAPPAAAAAAQQPITASRTPAWWRVGYTLGPVAGAPSSPTTRPRLGVALLLAACVVVLAVLLIVLIVALRGGDQGRKPEVLAAGLTATRTPAVLALTPTLTPTLAATALPPLSISRFAIDQVDAWVRGDASLHGCLSYAAGTPSMQVRLRVERQDGAGMPVDGDLVALSGASGDVCLDAPRPASLASGTYRARLYDAGWHELGASVLTVVTDLEPRDMSSWAAGASDLRGCFTFPGTGTPPPFRVRVERDAAPGSPFDSGLVTPSAVSPAYCASVPASGGPPGGGYQLTLYDADWHSLAKASFAVASGFVLRGAQAWAHGMGDLQGCLDTNLAVGFKLRLRAQRDDGQGAVTDSGPVAAVGAAGTSPGASSECVHLLSPGTAPAGSYRVTLYDEAWRELAVQPFTVVSDFTLLDSDKWGAGRADLQGCFGYAAGSFASAMHMRVDRPDGQGWPNDGPLLAAPDPGGTTCLASPATGVVAAGTYRATLYDSDWQNYAEATFVVQPPPAPVAPRPVATAAPVPTRVPVAVPQGCAVALPPASPTLFRLSWSVPAAATVSTRAQAAPPPPPPPPARTATSAAPPAPPAPPRPAAATATRTAIPPPPPPPVRTPSPPPPPRAPTAAPVAPLAPVIAPPVRVAPPAPVAPVRPPGC